MLALRQVSIGDGVLIGANCTIIDSDLHPIDAARRREHPESGDLAPVAIENDVFVGMQVLILKGSRLGQGAVIGAGRVVAGEIPPGVLAAGNPARVLRPL